jgi:hypothetical protein
MLLSGPLSSVWPFFPNSPLSPLRPSDHSTPPCPHYGPLSSLRPSACSTALCLLYSHPSSLKPYIPSMVLCLHLRYSVSSMALQYVASTALRRVYGQCPLFGPSTALCSQRPSATSTVLYPLYGPLPPQKPSILSIALLDSPFSLYAPLFPIRPSELSVALCLLYSPTSPLRPSILSTAF